MRLGGVDLSMAVLRPPLIFGDSVQIAASDHVALFERAMELLGRDHEVYECDDCHGKKKVPCQCECGNSRHYRVCGACNGTGEEIVFLRDMSPKQLAQVIAEEEASA